MIIFFLPQFVFLLHLFFVESLLVFQNSQTINYTSLKIKIQHTQGSIKRFNRKFLPFLLKEINDILKNINNSEKIFGINGSYVYLTDLLEKCLEHDKNKRITVDEALKHPFMA